MAKIGDVEVTILSEKILRSNEVTERKVEDGSISDNVKNKPDSISITGLVGIDGWESLKKLIEYKKEGKLIRFESRNIYKDLIIETLDTDHPYSARSGFLFSCTLKQIRITKAKLVSISVAKDITSQVKQTTNAGRQSTKKKSNDAEFKTRALAKYGITNERV